MRITEEAERDVENQGEFNRKKLLREIKDRLESDRSQEEITYISKPQFGIEFQRLKLKNKDFDHRVYFDYIDSELTVFAVRHGIMLIVTKILRKLRNVLNIWIENSRKRFNSSFLRLLCV